VTRNVVYLSGVERRADILLQKFEAGLVVEMGDVLHPSGQQVVGADDGVAFSQQRIAQMRPDKSRSTGY
jgi:hypothetical protein